MLTLFEHACTVARLPEVLPKHPDTFLQRSPTSPQNTQNAPLSASQSLPIGCNPSPTFFPPVRLGRISGTPQHGERGVDWGAFGAGRENVVLPHLHPARISLASDRRDITIPTPSRPWAATITCAQLASCTLKVMTDQVRRPAVHKPTPANEREWRAAGS